MRHFGHKVTAAEVTEHVAAKGNGRPTFFVDLTNVATRKCYGIQYVEPTPDRIMGAWGERRVTYTAPFTVQRGYRIIQIKASPANPVTVAEHLQFEEDR